MIFNKVLPEKLFSPASFQVENPKWINEYDERNSIMKKC